MLLFSCHEIEIYENDDDSLIYTNSQLESLTKVHKSFALELATKNTLKNITLPEEGEILLASLELDNILLRSNDHDSSVNAALSQSPTLTLAYPSLDYFPEESVNTHKDSVDFYIWLPQEQNETQGFLDAYNSSGQLISLNLNSLDFSKRYCVVKASESHYAINRLTDVVFDGSDKPSANSLGYFSVIYTVGDWDLYDAQDFINALNIDNGTPHTYVPTFNGSFGVGWSGNNNELTPRSPCVCEEYNFERLCEPATERLEGVHFTSRKASYEVESFMHGPEIELQASYVFYNKTGGVAFTITKHYRAKRHKMANVWAWPQLDIIDWDIDNLGGHSLVDWQEVHLNKKTYTTKVGYTTSVDEDQETGAPSQSVTTSASIATTDENFLMGNYYLNFYDDYCEGERYKVWTYGDGASPDDGFYFEQRKEP